MNDTVVNTYSNCVENSNQSLVTRTTLLNEGAVDAKREEILHYFHQTFTLYESLFVIRETRRKYQHTLAELSVWKKD